MSIPGRDQPAVHRGLAVWIALAAVFVAIAAVSADTYAPPCKALIRHCKGVDVLDRPDLSQHPETANGGTSSLEDSRRDGLCRLFVDEARSRHCQSRQMLRWLLACLMMHD